MIAEKNQTFFVFDEVKIIEPEFEMREEEYIKFKIN